MEVVCRKALESGADDAVACSHWADGGLGAVDLANAVVKASASPNRNFKFLYDVELPIRDKIEIITREMYGADGIELSELAQKKIEVYTAQVRYFISVIKP